MFGDCTRAYPLRSRWVPLGIPYFSPMDHWTPRGSYGIPINIFTTWGWQNPWGADHWRIQDGSGTMPANIWRRSFYAYFTPQTRQDKTRLSCLVLSAVWNELTTSQDCRRQKISKLSMFSNVL